MMRSKALVIVVMLLAIWAGTPPIQPAHAQAQFRFGSQPYADVVAVANSYAGQCAGLSTNRLAALSVTPVIAELLNFATGLTPSPMTMGRADVDPDAWPPNQVPARAFWHTGIGLWQLDDSAPGSLGDGLPAAARVHTLYSAGTAVPYIASRWCSSNGNFGTTWNAWVACNNNLQACINVYNSIYQSSGSNNISLDGAVTSTGGMTFGTCFNSVSGAAFSCARIDYNVAQGYTTNWTGNVWGSGSTCVTPNPLSVAFETWIDAGGWENRVWLPGDLGFGFNRGAWRHVPGGTVKAYGGGCAGGNGAIGWYTGGQVIWYFP
jgi:hypothetical protein